MEVLKQKFRINRTASRKKEPVRPSMPLPALPPATVIPLPRPLDKALRRVASRHLQVRLLECFAWMVAVLPTLWLAQALTDWGLNLPLTSRALLLIFDGLVLIAIFWYFGIRAWQRRWTVQTAALHVEKSMPHLRSALISAVQLASGAPGCVQGSLQLVRQLIDNVSRKLSHVDLAKSVVQTKRKDRAYKFAGLSLLLAGGAILLGRYEGLVLIERILLSDKPLPTPTIVEPITRDETVPMGSDVTLSARARGVVPRTGRVLLTYVNGEKQDVTASPSVQNTDVFLLTLNNVQQSFRYKFVLNDGTGPDFNVAAKAGPILSTLRCIQNYPDYTEMGKAEMSVGNLSFLAGSKIRLEGKSSQPLKAATLQLQGLNQNIPIKVSGPDSTMLEVEFPVPKEGLTGFSLSLVNTDNILSVNNTVYRTEIVLDKPPVVEMLFPKMEKSSVLMRAKPRLSFSVNDDFLLKDVKIKYEISRPPKPNGDEYPLEPGEIALPLKPKTSAIPQQEYVWDFSLPRLKLTEGCNITYWVEATDNNTVTGPGIGQSGKKMLSILSEAEKRAELLEVLGTKAVEIENISNKQKKTNDSLDSTIRRN